MQKDSPENVAQVLIYPILTLLIEFPLLPIFAAAHSRIQQKKQEDERRGLIWHPSS